MSSIHKRDISRSNVISVIYQEPKKKHDETNKQTNFDVLP